MNERAAFGQCARLRQVELDWFRERDVSAFVLAGYRVDPAATGLVDYVRVWGERGAPWCPDFSVKRARVEFLRGGTFAFEGERRVDPSATEPALILPAIEDGVIVDLIAWHPRTGRLACLHRLNWSGLLIGPRGLDRDEPLDVHPDPLSWLQACREGVVVVREALARPILLQQAALKANDIPAGEKLQAMLQRVRLPRIVVPVVESERIAA